MKVLKIILTIIKNFLGKKDKEYIEEAIIVEEKILRRK
ncbi:hypothetical protein EV215_0398 [Hypnocyclicus thermotrophus]|uniref:Uncharacterized protein n=1 Tax=Hypnocyclicus thermotrophus TaxID=1627895 RepID=A0AA46E1T0_9FUSO|nr:hypothetical protein EV215_0398 [Hypnocyclicus thermotrophus]